MDDYERRQELADFLRTRRARLSPEDVGLPHGHRRRTPGLRREEVAQLANTSASWYTSLEQGRDVHPSEQVLECLAQALRLTPDERHYLFMLVLQHAPTDLFPSEQQVSPALQLVLDRLNPHPAYVIGRRWDLLIWNSAAEYFFSLSHIPPPHTRNMVWRFFATPAWWQNDRAYWEEMARKVVSRFRSDSARYPGDPQFAELIADLEAISEQFRQWWSEHDVENIPDGHKILNHPKLGHVEFEQITLLLPSDPDLKLQIYAASADTASRLAHILNEKTT